MVKQSVDAEYQRIGFVSSHGTASGRQENQDRDLNAIWEVFKESGVKETFTIS